MKTIGIAALLVLSGCNLPTATSNGSGNGGQAAGNAASGASTGTAPTGTAPTLDRAFLVGRWTDTGDCNNATEFAQGGQFQTSSGASGQWSLAGDQLTLMGGQRLTMQVVIVDQNTINIVNPDGSVGRSTRC